MPIVIVKGIPPSNKTKSKQETEAEKRRYSDDDEDELKLDPRKNKQQSGAASNMDDVLQFKMFRVSKPNFIDGTIKTSLVGADIYRQYASPEKEQLIRPTAPTEKKATQDKPTLLQKIRCFKGFSRKQIENQEEESYLQKCRNELEKSKKVKAGQFLSNLVQHHDINETLQWSIRHVDSHIHELTQFFFELDQRIKIYDQEFARAHRFEGTNHANKSRHMTLPKFRMSMLTGRMSTLGMNNNMANNSNTSTNHNNSSNNNNFNGEPQSQKNVNKVAYLSQQLDLLKARGTDTFLRAVIHNQHAESMNLGRKAFIQNAGSLKLQHPAKTIKQHLLSAQSAGDQSPNVPNDSNHSPFIPLPSPISTSVTPSTNHKPFGGELALDLSHSSSSGSPREKGSNSPRGARSARHSQEENHRQNSLPLLEEEKEEVDEPYDTEGELDKKSSILEESDEEEGTAISVATAKSPYAPTAPSNRSNPTHLANVRKVKKTVKVDSNSQKVEGKSQIEKGNKSNGQNTNSRRNQHSHRVHKFGSQDEKKVNKRIEKQVGLAVEEFKRADQEYQQLLKKSKKSLQRTDRAGHHILRHFEGFTALRQDSGERANQLLEDLEFQRYRELEVKMKLLLAEDNYNPEDDDFSPRAGGDIFHFRQTAKHMQEVGKLKLLTEIRWFITLVGRMREYLKKMNNLAPDCCLKFVIVLQMIIELGFVITVPIFYDILLSSVFAPEDFRKNIVHQLIDAVRDGLGISAEEFVKFLEDHQLQTSAELINTVRLNAQKAMASTLSPTTPRDRKYNYGSLPVTPSSKSAAVVTFSLNDIDERVITLTLPSEDKEKIEPEVITNTATMDEISPTAANDICEEVQPFTVRKMSPKEGLLATES